MTGILVVSSGMVHPSLLCRRSFKKILLEIESESFRFSSNIETLTSLKLDLYSTAILYFHRAEISDPALAALENFVFNGGGLLAVHSASASFKQNKRYFDLIGGKFISHGKIEEFEVKPDTSIEGPYNDIPGFMVFDELYLHKFKEDISIHFYTEVNQKKEPVVWTREFGRGKVAYCSLGHCSPVFKSTQVKQIIQKSLQWVKNYE